MSEQHTVLYRKYRPENFDQVFGQEHIVKVLQGSLELGNIGHAYIFSGPRGTGKTTMARIFARELKCDPTDIIEIDAASNRGIDDIRALREGVRSLPFASPYKMYIIDEVHMLTKEAFNALLKTLEEPPAHVIFVLATTEVHKLPATVISRCQSFIFRAPQVSVLKEMIEGIAKQENFTLDPEATNTIALLGKGSFRDTQGVLQKLFSYSNDRHISQQEVQLVTGAPSHEIIFDIFDGLYEKNSGQVLMAIQQAEVQNIDPHILLEMLVDTIRKILYLRFSASTQKELLVNLNSHELEKITYYAQTAKNLNSQLLQSFLECYKVLHVSSYPYFPLEIALISEIEKNQD